MVMLRWCCKKRKRRTLEIITHKQTKSLWSHRTEPPGKTHKQRINSVYLSKASSSHRIEINCQMAKRNNKIKRKRKIYRNHVVKIRDSHYRAVENFWCWFYVAFWRISFYWFFSSFFFFFVEIEGKILFCFFTKHFLI